MRRFLGPLLVAGLVVFPATLVVAHVRLIHPSSGTALRWGSPANIGIVIQSTGSDDIADGSHETALRMAIQDWNAATGTTATLVENVSPASQARTDWESSSVHLMLFDETNQSGFFPNGSFTVALTPVWFSGSGVIQDADVLFNGKGYSFTTAGAPGHFDVEDVAAHELGHLLGLDHSGTAGATLYPYVDTSLVLHRSLSRDEELGLREAYPAGAYGQITGVVQRTTDSSAVSGAYVVARDASGRTQASILTTPSGSFALRGLDPGDYTVYARPFDGAVDEGNLGSGYAGKIDTDFEPAFYGSAATITVNETVALGTLQVGADVTLNLGTSSDTFPVRVVEGVAGQTVLLHGTGLAVGSTLTASDPDFLLGVPIWSGSQVTFQLTVPAGEPRGHVDLQVTNAAGRITVLAAALEVTPPSPAVSTVQPDSGTVDGGTALTLTGSGFQGGSRIVIGERIYTDGIDAAVVDASTITLTTAATAAGAHDVVVIDPCGVEGRLADAFTVLSAPEVAHVFPKAGAFTGGTAVTLAGDGFVDGLAVRIDGVDQGAVTVQDPTRASFTTFGGAPGGPYVLELENPDGAIATQVFAYVNQADPTVAMVTPDNGSDGGGSLLTLTGTGFTATMQASFLADLAEVPVAATSVTYVDASTLRVVTPAHAAGMASLWLEDTNESGVLVENVYTFTGGGGGGGGCSTVPIPPPASPRAILAGAWWLLAVLGWVFLRARSARTARA